MRKTSVFVRGLVQETIKEGEFSPNAPSTIKKKGSDKPLIDHRPHEAVGHDRR